ncbi:hypothetical protein ACIA98_36290 [Streptomyces sp. NPDC051366]|uniref:hypothetical protein n=1 Tax=Streptomyces sp. NPDC051366 TaxID=3365652 RepID=UPI0037A862C0
MTATGTRRVAPLLIATLLAGGGVSLSSTAFAAPTTTTASITTDTDSPRTVKHITKKPRTVKKLIRTVEKSGVGITDPTATNVNVDESTWGASYRTPCAELDCLKN